MKDITIDEFAVMMMKQFEGMNQKFEAIDKRFDAMDQRFDAMDQRFDAADKRFDKIEALLYTVISDVENIKDRLASIEEFVQKVNTAIQTNKEDIELALRELSIIKERVAKLEMQLAH